jgi:acyl-CoA reductase-like NAD-dependent aldehyde dehydrogenase
MKKNFIAGEWRGATSCAENINPSDTRDCIGYYAKASRADTLDAIAAAKQSFKAWSGTSPLSRFEALDAIGSEIIARKNELGDMLAREEGKTLAEACGEAHKAGHLFKYFASEVYRSDKDGYTSVRDGVDLQVRRQPIGVVGAITPWNFPLAIPAWKIAPALAYGNTVVFKPAELVPGSAWLLSDIISKAGLPEGVFNLVMGSGLEAGETLVGSGDVAGVTFTGSTKIGKHIGSRVFERGGKFQLEMGGKNPLIVLDDASLDTAVECAIQGSYYSTGQRCTASSRLIVTMGIHDAFVEAMIENIRSLVVGDARAPRTNLGPVVSEQQLENNESFLKIGIRDGADVRVGGERLSLHSPGHYLSPALFTNSSNQMQINQEEIFGPIAAIIPVADYDEALQTANDTDYGLSAGIITQNTKLQDHFVNNIEVGMAQINLATAGMDFHAPFTGRKGSSFGPPEKSSYCREFFTDYKVVHAAAK